MRRGRKSQEERLLELFRSRPNEWIPLPAILRLGIAQYNARVRELREAGHTIRNKTEWRDGVRNSWFLYEPAAPAEGGTE